MQLQHFVAALHGRPTLARHTFRLYILFAGQNGGSIIFSDGSDLEPQILPNCAELECMGSVGYDKRGDYWFCRSLEWAMCCPKLKLLPFYNCYWSTWGGRQLNDTWGLTPAIAALHQKGIKLAPSLNTLSLGSARGTRTPFDSPRLSSYPPQGFLNLRWVQHLILDQCCDTFPAGYHQSVRTLSMKPYAYETRDCYTDIAESFPNLEAMECGLPRNFDSVIFPRTVRELTFILPETGEYTLPENVLLNRMRHLKDMISSGALPQLRLLRLKTGAEGMLDDRVPAAVRSTQLDLACASAGVDLQLQLR